MHLLLSFEVCVISLLVSGPATQAFAHFEALCIRCLFDYAIHDNMHASAVAAQKSNCRSRSILVIVIAIAIAIAIAKT